MASKRLKDNLVPIVLGLSLAGCEVMEKMAREEFEREHPTHCEVLRERATFPAEPTETISRKGHGDFVEVFEIKGKKKMCIHYKVGRDGKIADKPYMVAINYLNRVMTIYEDKEGNDLGRFETYEYANSIQLLLRSISI